MGTCRLQIWYLASIGDSATPLQQGRSAALISKTTKKYSLGQLCTDPVLVCLFFVVLICQHTRNPMKCQFSIAMHQLPTLVNSNRFAVFVISRFFRFLNSLHKSIVVDTVDISPFGYSIFSE